MLRVYLALLLSVGVWCDAFAETSSAKNSTQVPTRQLTVAVGSVSLLDKDALAGYGTQAHGLQSVYEFVISERFRLGIDLAYRQLVGSDKSGSQLRYGLMMKDLLLRRDHFDLYFAYGLLMQVIRLQDVDGTGTAHDTKLAIGAEFNCWFLEAAYHISRLRYFNTEAVRLDYIEANGGYIFRW